MRERDSGRALKRWIARKKAEDGTWDDKVPIHPEVEHWTCKDALREDLKAQLREESGPGDKEMKYDPPKPGEPVVPYLWASDRVVDELRKAHPDVPWPDGDWMDKPADDPPASGLGWLLAILAGGAAWVLLALALMAVWWAVKH